MVESFDIKRVWGDVKGNVKKFGDDFEAGAAPVVKWAGAAPVVKWTAPKVDEVNPFTTNPDVDGVKPCTQDFHCNNACGRGIQNPKNKETCDDKNDKGIGTCRCHKGDKDGFFVIFVLGFEFRLSFPNDEWSFG